MDRFFRISERGSTVRTEILGGLVTFATMAYIVALNPSILGGVKDAAGLTLLAEPEANGVFVQLAPAAHAALTGLGWQFYRFIGEHGYRLMTSWATTPAQVDAFLTDVRAVTATGR